MGVICVVDSLIDVVCHYVVLDEQRYVAGFYSHKAEHILHVANCIEVTLHVYFVMTNCLIIDSVKLTMTSYLFKSWSKFTLHMSQQLCSS